VCGRAGIFDSVPSNFHGFSSMCVGGFRLSIIVRLSTTIYTTIILQLLLLNYLKLLLTGDDAASQPEIAGNVLGGFYPTFHNRFSRNTLVTRHFHNPHNIYISTLIYCIILYKFHTPRDNKRMGARWSVYGGEKWVDDFKHIVFGIQKLYYLKWVQFVHIYIYIYYKWQFIRME
jgi:hypothetical protein